MPDLPVSTDPNDYLNISNVLPLELQDNFDTVREAQDNQIKLVATSTTLLEPNTEFLPDAGTTGAFPDMDESQQLETPFYPSPLQIVKDRTANGEIPPDVFDNGADLHRYFTNYPAQTRDAGTPAQMYNWQTLAALMGTAATVNTRKLYQGAGTLLGYTGVSGTPATAYEFLVDSWDDDPNGTVLAIRNTAVPLNGFVSCGTAGIEFRKGLTLVNILGNITVLMPIIRRQTKNLR